MHFFYSLIIPFLSFSLQVWPRFANKYFGVDVWTRLIEIDHVKNNHNKIPGKITKRFIISGYFDYPPLFPLLFSFFNKKFLLKIQGFVSPFFDSLQNILVFFISYELTKSLPISLLAQIIYSLIPMIAVENSNLTPRSFGYLNFTLAYYPLLLFSLNHNFYYFFLGTFFAAILFLSHRFALQSFIFLVVFSSFAYKTSSFIISLVMGFLIALIITRGYYLRVLKGHLANIHFWVINYKYRFAHQIYGNRQIKKLDWVAKIYYFLSIFSPIFLFGINTWIISGFIFVYINFFHSTNFLSNLIYFRLANWIVFFYVFAAVVLKIKKLIPIGEGQRYLEMATVPSALLSSILFFYFYAIYGKIALFILIILLIFNLGLIIFIQIKGILKDKNRSLTENLKKTFNFINQLPATPRIICIPHQITTLVIYHTKADVLVNADNPGLMKITGFYPILKKPISRLKTEYNLNYLLLRESFAKLKDLKLKKYKVIFKSGDTLLIKL